MPRPPRPIAAGLVYHVVNQGNNLRKVFFKEGDYEAFLQSLLDLQSRKPFELYGYCLLNNRFHLLIRPQKHSISQLIQSVLISHSQRYRKRRKGGGQVWQGRFKSPVIENDEHLLMVLRYIEASPVRAKKVKRAGAYRWSSFAAHCKGQPNELLSTCLPYEQLSPYLAVRQRRWDAYVHQTADVAELAAIRRSVDRSLPFGSSSWIKKLSKKLGLDLTTRPQGRPKKQ